MGARVPRVSVRMSAKEATSLLSVSLQVALISVMGFTHTAFAMHICYTRMRTRKDERFFNRHISTPRQHQPLLPTLTIAANPYHYCQHHCLRAEPVPIPPCPPEAIPAGISPRQFTSIRSLLLYIYIIDRIVLTATLPNDLGVLSNRINHAPPGATSLFVFLGR